jgi:hypothetical protein
LALDTVALLTVTATDPEFVAVTLRVFVAPATTLPKSMLAFASEMVPICCCVCLGGLPALSPAQPAKKERPDKSRNSCAIFQGFSAAAWAECRAGQFGLIGGHAPPPLQPALIQSSGEDCQQCGPMFLNGKDFKGTYLSLAQGQRPNREWPNMAREIGVLGVRADPAKKRRSIALSEPLGTMISPRLRSGLRGSVDH